MPNDDEAGWAEALDEPEREPAAEPSPEEVRGGEDVRWRACMAVWGAK